MAVRSPRTRAICDLLAAHRELTALEWLEFRQTMLGAAVWLACAALACVTAWLAANVALVLAFRDEPWRGLGAVIAMNSTAAVVGAFQVRRLLRRPFFALTRRETEIDSRSVLKVLS